MKGKSGRRVLYDRRKKGKSGGWVGKKKDKGEQVWMEKEGEECMKEERKWRVEDQERVVGG